MLCHRCVTIQRRAKVFAEFVNSEADLDTLESTLTRIQTNKFLQNDLGDYLTEPELRAKGLSEARITAIKEWCRVLTVTTMPTMTMTTMIFC
jgi:hypothetical protein